ncbi:hypothetical protein [Pimelobacter simplex]|uniref:hypothetical protein n=1 Tax=Nocardioides simplex TaxID=2045 RepID=UPI003AAA711C
MSGERLRTELHRIADRAPEIPVPDDLFTRGRRAHTRARVLGAVLAVGCLALLAALVAPLLRPGATPIAGGGATAGVPDRLYGVPDDARRQEVGDTGVRRGAAVLLTDRSRATLVDAYDGSYHPLELPGFLNDTERADGGYLSNPPVALSPDGTRLVWGWVDGDEGGLRIADLSSGRVREVALSTDEGAGLLVMTVTWSANGRWLAWDGPQIDRWTDDARTGNPSFAGVLAAEDGRSSTVVVGDGGWSGPSGVAVSDDGALVAVSGDTMVRADERHHLTLSDQAEMTGLRFDGDRVVAIVTGPGAGRPTELVELPSGRRISTLPGPLPAELGALDARHLVHLSSGPADSDGPGAPEVRIVDPQRPSQAPVVIKVPDDARPASLALDLMPLDRPTVERPEPSWPWWTGKERPLLVVTGALLLGGLAALLWVRARSRPRTRAAPSPTLTRGRRGR